MTHVDPSKTQAPGERNGIGPREIRPEAGAGCRERAIRRVFTALFAAILCGGAQAAWALPTGFGTGCSVSGGTTAQSGNPGFLSSNQEMFSTGCGSQVTSNGRVAVAVQTDAGPSLFNFDQSATTSASATAGMGSLRALSISESTSTPEAYLYTSNGVGGITEDEYVAGGNSSAAAQWWDSLTVGGTPNENGYVVLEFSLDLHGQTSTSAVGASASMLSRLFITDGFRYSSQQILDLSSPGTVTTTIGFRPGWEVQVYGDLNAMSQSAAGRQFINACNPFYCYPVRGGYVSASNAVADAGNTAGFRIDVLTPGGSYSTSSGQSYTTAVPEPATAELLAFGLLGLAGALRRRPRSGAYQVL